jgi:tryptophan synthase alpha chain
MSNRIEARFAALKAQGRAAFIAYIMAGDPTAATSLEILKALPAAGADLIELGFPFSDPMAEGVPIQRAAQRALAAGMTLRGVLDMTARFREDDQATPIILMGYLNNLESYGFARFADDAATAGVDGLIVVDCPPEEADPLVDALEARGLALIRLATPTTDDERLKIVARRTALPVAVGFGIKTPERAAAIARVADAVVVGSALVDEIAAATAQGGDPVARVVAAAHALAEAVRQARVPEKAS